MEAATLSPQMILVLAVLALTVYMFVSEIVRVDVAAIVIMSLLGLTNLFQPKLGATGTTPWLEYHFPSIAEQFPWLNQMLTPLVPAGQLFDGFASNAVISIIAVIIIGAGLDKTGMMSRVATIILNIGGTTEKRIIPLISGTVGVISSFMQNVGAAALFLPVVSRISARTGLPLSRLLMPMGFCAILGGTLTMVGSSPVILLNDLIRNSNQALPEGVEPMRGFELFDIAPIGLALVAAGILYFVLFGRLVLPARKSEGAEATNTLAYFKQAYGLDYELREVLVTPASPIAGKTLDEVERQYKIRVVAAMRGGDLRIGPGGLGQDVVIESSSVLGVLGTPGALRGFIETNRLIERRELETLAESLTPSKAGVAELVIPPGSNLIGKSARELWMRKTYGVSVLAIHRQGATVRGGEGVRDMPLQAGDILAVHTPWTALRRLERDRNFVVVTTEYPHEEERPQKVPHALAFFGLALALVLFTDLRLSIALLAGAVGMIVTGVLSIDEAYEAVSWKTVFLLASLIPLGAAVETTGTAAWIAQQSLSVMEGIPHWGLQTVIAVLATVFTLVMSNVGATVLLVPLAVNMAVGAGADPRVFALTVAIATSNSFLIPTHQVNALIMGPGGYRVTDFLRAGGIMTVLFLVVMMVMLNLVF